ncbi:hypothetical protein ACFY3U_16760 [Micromonospora sp. NPDC000089]|uniref:hypothetical protein n=1 Tax=unclassified Micromonospora TaxID=2617518 RepID=UPI0036C407C8
MSGAPYPPAAGGTYPPVSGAGYPPVSGAGYPPPQGGPYPPAPGAPLPPGYPPAAPKSNRKTWIIVGVVVAVLVLLCCGGLVTAAFVGAHRASEAADEVERSLPSPRGVPVLPSAGPATAKPDTNGETFNMKPGETLRIEDEEGTIEITVRKFSTSTKGCRSYAPAPDRGLYLIADVTATVTKGKASINPFYFQWVAEDGTTVNGLAGALSGCGGDMLDSGSGIRAGGKRTGAVVFDVKDKNGVVEYQHDFEAAGSWKP